MIERAVTLAESDTIDLDDLPRAVRGRYADALSSSLERNDTLRVWASRYARLVYERSHHNKRAACRALGISYHTLQSYLQMKPDAGAPAQLSSGRPEAAGAADVAHEPVEVDA
jgi:transcriptional regulator with PAS, ATPase and Fis domain